jgi:hypothetical protein
MKALDGADQEDVAKALAFRSAEEMHRRLSQEVTLY